MAILTTIDTIYVKFVAVAVCRCRRIFVVSYSYFIYFVVLPWLTVSNLLSELVLRSSIFNFWFFCLAVLYQIYLGLTRTRMRKTIAAPTRCSGISWLFCWHKWIVFSGLLYQRQRKKRQFECVTYLFYYLLRCTRNEWVSPHNHNWDLSQILNSYNAYASYHNIKTSSSNNDSSYTTNNTSHDCIDSTVGVGFSSNSQLVLLRAELP